MTKRLLFLILFLSGFRFFAQIDTSFWFVAPKVPNAIGTTTAGFQFITYASPATIIAVQPANGAGLTFTINLPANTSTLINVTASLSLITNSLANTTENRGIYIRSTSNISANFVLASNVGQETIGLKGRIAGLGTDFYLPYSTNFNVLNTGTVTGNTAFDFVATEPGLTTVVMTPKGNLIGPRAKNNTFVKVLNQGQTFSGRELSKAFGNPRSLIKGDFNNDTRLDIAVIDDVLNRVFIQINDGNGTFNETSSYTLGLNPRKGATADVNNDGNLDLLIPNQNSNFVSVYLGSGNGFFTPVTNVTTSVNQPVSVAIQDINGDLNRDLVVVTAASNVVQVYTGNGAGAFTFLSQHTVGVNPSDVAITDFNSDGFMDLAVSNRNSNNVSILRGVAPIGSFTTAINYATTGGNNPINLELADMNGDLRLDIITANAGGNMTILSAGTGTNSPITFTLANSFGVPGNQVSGLTVGFFNADANPDVAVTNFLSSSMTVFLGTGTLVAPGTFNGPIKPFATSAINGDFDGDGITDIVTSHYNSGSFAINTGNNTNLFTANILEHVYGNTFSTGVSELAGSLVAADKKIAMTASGGIQTTTNCPSFYADQLTNLTSIGKNYVLTNDASANTTFYVLSYLNGANVTITSGTTTVNTNLNSQETFSFNPQGNAISYVNSDIPVYLFSLNGNGCKLGGSQIAPAYCAGNYTTNFTRNFSDSLFLNIYTRNGYQSTFTLAVNNVSTNISPSNFTIVPGSANDFVAARIYYNTTQIPAGSNCILANEKDIFGLNIENKNIASGNAFSHLSSFNVTAFAKANVVPTATICGNSSFTLNGVVGGGPNTAIWTHGGFGALSFPNTTYTNNIYTPALLDTILKPVPQTTPATVGGVIKFVLTSTGICPSKSDTLKLYVKQPPLVNAGSTQFVCSNNPTVQLAGNVISTNSLGIWNAVAPANGTFTPSNNLLNSVYNLSNTDTALSKIKLILTSTGVAGCNPVIDTFRIIMKKAPLVKASTINPIIRCSNNPNVFLSGVVSGTTTNTGSWQTFGSGVFIPNNNSLVNNYIPSAADILAGTVKLKLSSTNNQECRKVMDSVNVVFTQPASVNLGPDLNSCKNNPQIALAASISGTVTNSGAWFGGAGTFTNTNTSLTPTYIASPAEAAAGFVVLSFSTTNNANCNSVNDQIRIDFRDKPTANFTVSSVCLNQQTNFTDLTVNTGGQGALTNWQWNFSDGTTSFSQNPTYTYSNAATYTTQLVVNNNFGCYDTIRRLNTVYALPNASFTVGRSCSGSAQLISFTDQSTIASTSGIAPSGYYWDFGGFGLSFAKDTSIIFPNQGVYNITHIVTSTNNCVSSITKSVNITPRPRAQFYAFVNTQPSLISNVGFADSSTAAISWVWDFGNGAGSQIQNPQTTYTANGTYTVSLTITDQFGCLSSISKTITINNVAEEIAQLIPNIISPNNDGKNDIWRLDFINVFYPDAEIEIYNRLGEQIYFSKGYSNAWDGSYKGTPLPVGAYFYIIKLNEANKENKIFKGSVTLLK